MKKKTLCLVWPKTNTNIKIYCLKSIFHVQTLCVVLLEENIQQLFKNFFNSDTLWVFYQFIVTFNI